MIVPRARGGLGGGLELPPSSGPIIGAAAVIQQKGCLLCTTTEQGLSCHASLQKLVRATLRLQGMPSGLGQHRARLHKCTQHTPAARGAPRAAHRAWACGRCGHRPCQGLGDRHLPPSSLVLTRQGLRFSSVLVVGAPNPHQFCGSEVAILNLALSLRSSHHHAGPLPGCVLPLLAQGRGEKETRGRDAS